MGGHTASALAATSPKRRKNSNCARRGSRITPSSTCSSYNKARRWSGVYLLPTAEGIDDKDYVAVTPLNAAGLSELIGQRVAADIAQKKAREEKPQYRNRALLGYGGSNPQNVGRWVRSMGRAMVFDSPTEEPAVRKAYAIFYNGLQLREQLKPQLDAYAQWRHKELVVNRGRMNGDLVSRSQEAALLTDIANRALALGRAAEAH